MNKRSTAIHRRPAPRAVRPPAAAATSGNRPRALALRSLAFGPLLLAALAGPAAALAAAPVTPIEHLIVIVGENRSFDNLFATYEPRPGQTVANLLSRGIVRRDGSPGPRFAEAAQKLAANFGPYTPTPTVVGTYDHLPPPHGRGGSGPDRRYPPLLANGPYPITPGAAYGDPTGDPVHRFFQMWQQVNGGRHDLFVWTAEMTGTGPSNQPGPRHAGHTGQGGIAMGFYNMATGDAPYLKQLADRYAMSDNHHQSVMGGTTANYFALATGDVARYNLAGRPAVPPARRIENPDARPDTNNWYTEDGYDGGTYVKCADPGAPGVAGIRRLLAAQPYRPFNDGNCAPDTYYLVNNLDPGYTPTGVARVLEPDSYLMPPQTIPHIGDALSAAGVSWKWYSGGRHDGHDADGEYCATCDPLTAFTSTMTGADRQKLQDLSRFYEDAGDAARFPAVAVIAPPNSISGHPGYSALPGFESLVQSVVDRVRANPELWRRSAILITWDEGGGYYDSGYVQFIDFFGDGPRIPLIAVSPYARPGHVDHTYSDLASILKFIERNWRLPPISPRSRDNLPNPVADPANPYVPANRPAIGDLMDLFDFTSHRP